MRTFTTLTATAIVASLTACNPSQPATLGDPIYLDIPAEDATGPRLADTADGRLVLSWMSGADEGASLRFATIDNARLTDSRAVTTDARMFVNWADLPAVMQVRGAHWLAYWMRYSADKTYSYDVVVSQSFDGGETWSEPVPAHDDGTHTEHGFVSTHLAPDGVALLWLDGRNTPAAPMTLRSAVITPGGERTRAQEIDDSVCDCCQTDVAISSKGPIAVYRDRTADEIRDIYVTRFTDGEWEPGARLHADNWNIAGCPVNGPSIVADGERVAVAWFSAADNAPVVKVLLSTDGGVNFGAPVEIAAGRLAGYVGLAFIDDATLAVSWVARAASGANSLRLRTISMAGTLGEVREIAEISQTRVFPQLGYQDGQLFLFWSDQAADNRQLHGAAIPIL